MKTKNLPLNLSTIKVKRLVTTVMVLLGFLLYTNNSNAQVCFTPDMDFGLPNPRPNDIISADFNNDGWSDFATTNPAATSIIVYINNQHGGYTQTNYPEGGEDAWQIIAADFNGDGYLDLAWTLPDDGNVKIYLNNTSGGFTQASTPHFTSFGNYGVTVGDFNHDGKLDLAVTNQTDLDGNVVSIAFGNNDGTFVVDNEYQTDDGSCGSAPYGVVAGDFNGDGILDLAIANSGSSCVSILLGNGTGTLPFKIGDGTFGAAATYPTGGSFSNLVTADFNHDGILDIATANPNNNNISVLRGNGDGSFQANVDYTVGATPNVILAGDFNGDGVIDLATDDITSNQVSVLICNTAGGFGTGTFKPAVSYSTTGSTPYGVAAGDFNHDAKLDLITCNLSSSDNSLLLNNGTFSSPFNVSFAAAVTVNGPVADGSPFAIATADFNGDGKMDLAVANTGDAYVTVYLGNGDGTFKPLAELPISAGSTSIYCSDVAGSGHQSIVTTNGDNTVAVLLGHGDGTFDAVETYTTVHSGSGNGPTGVISGEFEPEEATDLITSNNDGTISALTSNATGQFNAPTIMYSSGGDLSGITAADFNHDGNLDVAVTDYNNNKVYDLLCNVGVPSSGLNGIATLHATLSTGNNPSAIVNGNFNGDSWADIAVANYSDNSISVFLNDGAGGFGAGSTFNVGASPTSIAAADFNGDGKTDLVTANSGDGTVSVLLGNGSGGFGVANPFAVGNSGQYSPEGVTTGDFNGDRIADLATANPAGAGSTPEDRDGVTVLLSTPPATPTTPTGTTALCQGSTPTTYHSSSAGASSYTWSITTAAGSVSGTGTSATVTWSSTYTGTASVSVRANGSCGTSSAASTIVTINVIPTAPVATAGTGATNTQITANWNTVGGASGYFLDVATDNGFSSFVTGFNNLNVGNVLTKNVTGLSSGTTYYYRVRATNGTCTSTNSNTITYATTGAGASCPFTGGAVTKPYTIICSGNTTTLTVTGSTGNNYNWQISTDNTNWSDISGATTTSYTTAGGDGTTNKFYRLMSKSVACYNVTSTTAEVDVSNPTIVITTSNITDNSLTLNWGPTGSGNYTISYSGPTSATLTSVTPPKTLTGLTAGGTYNVTVTQTGVGCTASGTITGVTTLCAMPTGVTLSSPANGQILVSWTGVGGADYRVYYRPLFSYNTYFTKDVSNVSSVLLTKQGNNNLYASTTYEVYVSRLDCPTTGATGQPTNPANVTTLPNASCATPMIDSVRSLCPVQIEVFIHDNGVNQYSVFMQRITPTILAVNSYGVSGTYFTINTPYSGDQYLIAIEAKCGGTLSNLYVWPGSLSIKPLCSSPANLVLSNPTCHGFTASWNADQCLSNSASEYALSLRVAGTINYNSYGVSLPLGGVNPSKQIGFATPGRAYQVFVRSIYNCNGFVTYGPSSQVQTISTLSSGCRDEDEQQAEETKPSAQQYSPDNSEVFSLYPNPNNGEFAVNLSRLGNEEDAVRIEVINMIGQTVVTHLTTISGGQMSEFINLPTGTAAGTYIVRLTAGKNVYTAKVNISK